MIKPANNLPDDITRLKRIVAEQVLSIQKYKEELSRSKTENDRLEEIVRLLRHHRFGSRSEKVKSEEDSKQLGIFNEAEVEDKTTEEPASIEVKSHRRRGKPKRIKLPEDLPREDIVIDLDEEDRFCSEGHELKCIGEDVSEQLDVIPAQVKVKRTIRKKYVCEECEGHMKRAPLPKVAIPKSIAGAGLLANIATSKYGDGLPLYRQEQMWQRLGIEIPRTTMATWMIRVGELLTPVLNLMEEDLLSGGYVQADETRVQVLKEPGKSPQSRSYMWVRGRHYPGAPPIILFEYDPTRSGDVAKRLFVDYAGYLQADGYTGYNELCLKEDVIRIGCWAHARRKFFEAAKASKKGVGLANEAIEKIRKIYAVEKEIRDKDEVRDDVDERHKIRLEKSKPLLDEFREWLDDHLGQVPPKSQLGNALAYAHNEWPNLIRYLDDGRLSIDNNMVENAIRPFVIGRKNWLFSESVAGAKASAAIYSVMVSAKQNGHNEYAYFRYLLEKLPLAEKIEDYEVLLPHRLLPADVPTQWNNHVT